MVINMANIDFSNRLNTNHKTSLSALETKIHIDFTLLILLIILAGVGIFTLYSASGQKIETVWRQVFYLAIGFLAMIIVSQIPPRTWIKFSAIMYLGGIILLLAVLVVGTSSKGAQRWLEIFRFRFQPSEMMKFIMPVAIASYFSYRSIPISIKDSIAAFFITLIPVVLISMQPDLGTSILVFIPCFLVIFMGGLSKAIIMSTLLILAPSTVIFWKFFMYEYQQKRVLTFINPENDPWGAGWNIIQSKIAIGSGGISGKGWLHGTQSHLNFLPEKHTDFIISVFAEEFGLIGVIALLTLYMCIIARCLYISLTVPTLFGRLLAGSLALTFFVYIFINMGMVSGILPVVGVPLPLISKGGTSLLTLLINFGLIMSVYTHRPMHGTTS
jgi:rod shape determining protein RodA